MPKKGDRVTMMFSATFPEEVQSLARGESLTCLYHVWPLLSPWREHLNECCPKLGRVGANVGLLNMFVDLILTPEVEVKLELLFNEPASGYYREAIVVL